MVGDCLIFQKPSPVQYSCREVYTIYDFALLIDSDIVIY